MVVFPPVTKSEFYLAVLNPLLQIVTYDGDLNAGAGRSVTLTPTDEIDISRGDIITSQIPVVAQTNSARIIWMNDSAMMPGRQYLFKSNFRLRR